ncbi:hypothetical protein RRG08_015553 [Elysia crispata]|uniref:Uncharacterized protein n=1 Tax=Elysia crispata TaxID=231223 RepID=A0AAE0YJ92_9GAST|nr:hypothetical protein RRG08_015553 [Elysia crispata]
MLVCSVIWYLGKVYASLQCNLVSGKSIMLVCSVNWYLGKVYASLQCNLISEKSIKIIRGNHRANLEFQNLTISEEHESTIRLYVQDCLTPAQPLTGSTTLDRLYVQDCLTSAQPLTGSTTTDKLYVQDCLTPA